MLRIDPSDLRTSDLQTYMQAAIAPRPICFASTVDKEGNVNLSPFSFFNMMSSNPPLCVFSPSRRVRDNTTKHTLENLYVVPECVINIVNYPIVYQTSLASTEFPGGINEFIKAGLTPLESEVVKPPRVAESPVQFECTVNQIIPLGEQPGAGNLVIAEVKLIHIKEDILDDSGKIDQTKIDLVARLGGDWYCRVTEESLFKIPKPITKIGIGIDGLPEFIKNSPVLTGNHLGQLANIEKVPSLTAVVEFLHNSPELQTLIDVFRDNPDKTEEVLHRKAKILLDQGRLEEAWMTLMTYKLL